MTGPLVSLVICTYNRVEILAQCLDSLQDQTEHASSFEILVIDNNSSDNTHGLVTTYVQRKTNFRYIVEKKQGLSAARNTGFREAKGAWVGYIDDDAIAPPDYVRTALKVINNYCPDCFGGYYTPFYICKKPQWLLDEYESSPQFSDQITYINKTSFLSGSVIFFKRSVLEEVNGFYEEIGMNGSAISYGEETEIQLRLHKRGNSVAFIPELRVKHLVAEYKMNLAWYLKSSFLNGKNHYQIHETNPSYKDLFFIVKDALTSVFHSLPRSIMNLKKNGYYWQNLVLDCFRGFFFGVGKSIGLIKRLA